MWLLLSEHILIVTVYIVIFRAEKFFFQYYYSDHENDNEENTTFEHRQWRHILLEREFHRLKDMDNIRYTGCPGAN